jgi:hypothetical protein
MAKSKGRAATFAVIARQRANEPRERLRNSAAAGGGKTSFGRWTLNARANYL